MKMNSKLRRILLTVCSAALLVCVTVGATVAYLTSTDKVENTFTVGKVAITLDEAAIKQDETTKNWVEDETADPKRVTENQYKLLPGITYAKDPTVTVKAGSEKAYVRVLVTVSEKNDLDTLFAKYASKSLKLTDVVLGISADWTPYGQTKDDTADTRTYELRYKSTVDASASTDDIVLDDVFEQIKVPDYFTNADIAAISGLKIEVVAQAIQADGFTTADAAWKAFDGE